MPQSQSPRDRPTQLELVRQQLSKHPPVIPNDIEAVVGVLLLEAPSRDFELLLVKRIEREGDPWSGHIGFPGGRIKPTDSSSREALEREVWEEVGINLLKEGKVLGTLTPAYPSNRPELKVQPWVYGLNGRPIVQTGPEIVEAFWVAVSELPRLLTQSEVMTRGGKRMVDSYLVGGRIVWGFTFRVLSELLQLWKELG